MAFTGTAVVELVNDRFVRITGLSLAAGASGSIGLTGKSPAAEVTLPAGFQIDDTGPSASIGDQLVVHMVPVTAVATAVPIQVAKGGTKHQNFSITLTNNTVGTASPQLEIYVESVGS